MPCRWYGTFVDEAEGMTTALEQQRYHYVEIEYT